MPGAQMVGKYEIVEKIGEGGFGIVYKAVDTSLDRLVALKQLRSDLSSSTEYLNRFMRESRSLASLNHPSIIRILEIIEDNGRHFIVMDYLPNGSLADRLQNDTPFSPEKALEILRPIARAIDYAHKKNLVHRDIKPSNILFNEEDEPVLSDFGLVKSLETKGSTNTGFGFGTPEYMAPEQILGKELTPAADLYALGVVAFELLTGKVPFPGNTPYEVQEGHVHAEPPDILQKNAALPAELVGIFPNILAKDPAQRYSSAKEFVQELDKINGHQLAERNREKIEQARVLLNEKDFTKAAAILNVLHTNQPEPELEELLETCKHREQVWMDYQKLVEQSRQLTDKLKDNQERIRGMEDSETWLTIDKQADPIVNGNQNHEGSDTSETSTCDPDINRNGEFNNSLTKLLSSRYKLLIIGFVVTLIGVYIMLISEEGYINLVLVFGTSIIILGLLRIASDEK